MAFFASFFTFFKKNKNQHKADAIIFGIGNIGKQYENTRHNIGFTVVDRFAENHGVSVHSFSFKKHLLSTVALVSAFGKNILLVKPVTFVNKSGGALQACVREYAVPVSQCLVVVDDYNLGLGIMRFRRNGSDGGHNGLKSLIQSVGTEFPRVRVGIGPKEPGIDTIEFVLGRFTLQEQEKMSVVSESVIHGIELFLEKGIDTAMTVSNNKKMKI